MLAASHIAVYELSLISPQGMLKGYHYKWKLKMPSGYYDVFDSSSTSETGIDISRTKSWARCNDGETIIAKCREAERGLTIVTWV